MIAETGAIDLLTCPDWPKACKCGIRCIICGFNKHFAVHGPCYGGLPGSEPYDHQYQPPIKSSCPSADEILRKAGYDPDEKEIDQTTPA